MRWRSSCRSSATGSRCAAPSIAAAATAILDNEPDVALVLLDLALPGTRGLDLLADLMLDYPGVPIVVLSATHDMATVNAALCAGARGFVPKTADPRMLLDAIRHVLDGGAYRTTDVTLLPDRDGVHIGAGRAGTDAVAGRCAPAPGEGKPNKIICRDLQALRRHRQGARQRDPQGAAMCAPAPRRWQRSPGAASAPKRSPTTAAKFARSRMARAAVPLAAAPPSPGRAPIRSHPVPPVPPHDTLDGARRIILCTVLWEQESPRHDGPLARRLSRQPVMARRAGPRLSTCSTRTVAEAPRWGRYWASARHSPARSGAPPPSRCYPPRRLPGAADRLHFRRGPRRPPPHRGLQSSPSYGFILRGAGPADRARRLRGRTRCTSSPRS